MNLQIIATAHNGFSDKFGIPRQSQETSSIETKIVFEPTFRDENMLRGIEGYSHLWLIWEFSQIGSRGVEGRGVGATGNRLQATVRPPRLGGNTRVGVFATRSPFRPNRLGLSSVELVRVEKTATEGTVLIVRGADLLDGTPIYDIKPYLSYSDSHPDARNGFGETTKDYKLKVDWSTIHNSPSGAQSTLHHPQSTIATQVAHQIEEILSQDPRPAYQSDPERIYKLDYAGWKVCFRVEEETAYIVKIEKNN
mgnify:CR=1 FL=1